MCLNSSPFEKLWVWQFCYQEQSGAAEACWAHNPEVDGSKPSSAKTALLRYMRCSYLEKSCLSCVLKPSVVFTCSNR